MQHESLNEFITDLGLLYPYTVVAMFSELVDDIVEQKNKRMEQTILNARKPQTDLFLLP